MKNAMWGIGYGAGVVGGSRPRLVMMGPIGRQEMCKAWNADPVLTGNWFEMRLESRDDKNAVIKIMQIYRRRL